MSHMINSIAFKGETPWHGLGIELPEGQSIDQWRIAAGMDWKATKTNELYNFTEFYDARTGRILTTAYERRAIDCDVKTRTVLKDSGQHILIRDDNGMKLGNCTDRYQIVQPATVLEFYRDLCSDHGFALETAGCLDDGKRIWALAKTGDTMRIKGNDPIESYLLLATSFDGTMSTRALFTAVRVVCHNTISMALRDKRAGIKVGHSTEFDHNQVKIDLGIYQDQKNTFQSNCEVLAARKVSRDEALKYVFDRFAEKGETIQHVSTRKANIIQNVMDLFNGKGKGSQLPSAANTAWGLVNAVTEFVDWEQGNNVNNRFRNAQFGQGVDFKIKAFEDALELAKAA